MRIVHLFIVVAAVLALLATGRPAHAQAADEPSGIVKITSDRPASQVYVDNEPVGDAPIVRYLPVGSHLVRVVADGFDPFVRKVDVVQGRTMEVAAQLLPGTGTVEFQVQAPSAVLIVNGRDQWPLPVRLRDLAPGEYRYRIEAPGHEPAEGSFAFVPGKNLLFVEQLKKTAGLVSVRSTPEGARVWLDGESVGATPVVLEAVPAGVHAVRLALDDHATVIRTLDTSDGQKGELAVRLHAGGAALVVQTGRKDAAVSVGGTPVDTGEVVRLKALERGRYEVVVTAPGFHTATGRADVPQRGRAAYKVRLQPTDARAASRLVEIKPFYERWAFWTAVGVGAAGGATGGLVAWRASRPVPVAEGDVIVDIP